MSDLKVGDQAPDFDLPGDGDKAVRLQDYRGNPLVLYFYPKDMTSGCTRQAEDFRDQLAEFSSKGAAVVGVSRDKPQSHDKFIAKHDLTFRLASDLEGDMVESYGVWKEKSMYGRKYFGIERTTFLIDGNGVIQRIWPKVKVPGHVAEVLAAI